jgi:hypothetical protein
MQEGLIEAMRFDIEEGNLCDYLLEIVGSEDGKRLILLSSLHFRPTLKTMTHICLL